MLYIFLVQFNLDVIGHRSSNESPSSFLSVLHFFQISFCLPMPFGAINLFKFLFVFCFGCIFSALQTTISSRCLVFGIFSNTLFLLHYAFQHHLFYRTLPMRTTGGLKNNTTIVDERSSEQRVSEAKCRSVVLYDHHAYHHHRHRRRPPNILHRRNRREL